MNGCHCACRISGVFSRFLPLPWIVLLLAGSKTSLAEPILFWPSRLVFPAQAEDIALGDLNGDEALDVVAAGGSEVSVLLGNGDGTFGPPSVYPAGPTRSIVLADLDGDEVMDVVAGGDSVWVFLGLGDGRLVPVATYPATNTGWGTSLIALGDFNSDRVPDLACTEPEGVGVLLGAGDGTFGPPTLHPVGSDLVATADLNGDLALDLIAVGEDLAVLLGRGDGTFAPPAHYAGGHWSRDLAVADLDGDQVPDVATLDSNYLYILHGLGDGGLAPPVVGWGGPYSGWNAALAVGDLSGDPSPDLAVAVGGNWGCQNGNVVEVLTGLGDGTFVGGVRGHTGYDPSAVSIGDLNGDHASDLLIASDDGVSVLLGLGQGGFASEETVEICYNRVPSSVTIGNLFGDSTPEMAVLHDECGDCITLLSLDGSSSICFGSGAYAWLSSLVIADLNADQVGDLAVTHDFNSQQDEVKVLLGQGGGTFSSPESYVVGADPTDLATGDVNGDGIPDLGVASSDVAVLLGTGDGGFAPPIFPPLLAGANALAFSDLDSDGSSDLALASDDSVRVFLARGEPMFEPAASYGAGGTQAVFADLNGDQRDDIVVAGSSLAVLLGLGGGSFQQPSFYSGSGGSVAISDLNGDGVRDLATMHRGAVNVFVGRGDGTFVQSGIRYGAGDGEALTIAPGHRIAAGDVSGDGANDLAVASARTYFSFVVLLHGRFQSPNAVELSAFEAQSVAEGILVSWSTAFASDHAGFHVHRSTRSDGARERLTPKLILPDEPYRFLDRGVTEATSYFYWLEALDLRGGQQWFGPLAATWARAPRGNRLLAGAPNPFRPGAAPVRIAFEVATDTRASLRVYDVSGRLVRIVLDKKVGAERHEVSWNGRDERGGAVSSGIYFYRLDAGEYSATRSLVLLR